MSRGPDAATLLRRALERHAHAAGCALAVTGTHSTRWASATFTGARHHVTLDGGDDPALDAWLDALPEADFTLPGHLVADLTIDSRDRAAGRTTTIVAALTVET